MRFLGMIAALCVALCMAWLLPGLWQRAMIHEVRKIEAGPPAFAVTQPVSSNFADAGDLTSALQPPPLDIDTREAEALGVESAVNEQQQQIRDAEDHVPQP